MRGFASVSSPGPIRRYFARCSNGCWSRTASRSSTSRTCGCITRRPLSTGARASRPPVKRSRRCSMRRSCGRGVCTWLVPRPPSSRDPCSCSRLCLRAATATRFRGPASRVDVAARGSMMDRCDVLIVGGGPSGSACAWKLRRAGLDVVIMDAALFPRDKVCAGWITPQVVDDLEIDVDDYRRGRTFQPITGFRTGIVNGQREIDTVYDCPVSFGIRRCEFDHYLLQRSGARLKLGAPVSSIRRNGASWVLNEAVTASMLVGAGGHFCPIARMLGRTNGTPLVVAQEIEFALHARDAPFYRIAPEQPELYFCRDLKGYGWCFRKQNFLNVGFGRLDRHSLPKA